MESLPEVEIRCHDNRATTYQCREKSGPVHENTGKGYHSLTTSSPRGPTVTPDELDPQFSPTLLPTPEPVLGLTGSDLAESPVTSPDLAANVSPPVPLVDVPDAARVPGYQILEVLGRGGMGVVYKARHLRLNRVVALKMILHAGHAGPDELLRFLQEAETIAAIKHSGVVQIFDFGTHEGTPY